MSANNQTLVQEYKGRWYVFENVQAESWVHYDETTDTFDDARTNELSLSSASKVFSTEEEALMKAFEVDDTEYGVMVNVLAKDGEGIKIIESNGTL